jgi:hypothetical protein
MRRITDSSPFIALVSRVATLEGGTFAGTILAHTPNAGTTGAVRIIENPTSGVSFIQFIDSTFAYQRAFIEVNASGIMTFSGTIAVGNDANFTLNVNSGSQPFLGFDNGDNFSYVRSSNTFVWNIANTSIMAVSATKAHLALSAVPTYADNSAATTGGLAQGDLYRTSTGQLMIRY